MDDERLKNPPGKGPHRETSGQSAGTPPAPSPRAMAGAQLSGKAEVRLPLRKHLAPDRQQSLLFGCLSHRLTICHIFAMSGN